MKRIIIGGVEILYSVFYKIGFWLASKIIFKAHENARLFLYIYIGLYFFIISIKILGILSNFTEIGVLSLFITFILPFLLSYYLCRAYLLNSFKTKNVEQNFKKSDFRFGKSILILFFAFLFLVLFSLGVWVFSEIIGTAFKLISPLVQITFLRCLDQDSGDKLSESEFTEL